MRTEATCTRESCESCGNGSTAGRAASGGATRAGPTERTASIELGTSAHVLNEASRGIDSFADEAATALSQLISGSAALRMGWAELEDARATNANATAALARERKELAEERGRLSVLAAERETVVQGQAALREAQATIERERQWREAEVYNQSGVESEEEEEEEEDALPALPEGHMAQDVADGF